MDTQSDISRWWTYVKHVAQGASATEIAKITGVNQSSVSRWQNAIPVAASVRQFAVAYHQSVIEAMIAAGYLTEMDVAKYLSAHEVRTFVSLNYDSVFDAAMRDREGEA
jgi:hypothetical protein